MVQGSQNLTFMELPVFYPGIVFRQKIYRCLVHVSDAGILLSSVQLEGELPPKCFQEANALNVPRVSQEDSGTYVCTASNKQGKVEAFTRLEVLGESAG